jgi:hypothetical protein
LAWSSGGIGIAKAPKGAKVLVGGGGAKEGEERSWMVISSEERRLRK